MTDTVYGKVESAVVGDVVKVIEKEFKDNKYIDIRVWFTQRETEQEFPSKKGITIRKDVFHELMKVLNTIK